MVGNLARAIYATPMKKYIMKLGCPSQKEIEKNKASACFGASKRSPHEWRNFVQSPGAFRSTGVMFGSLQAPSAGHVY